MSKMRRPPGQIRDAIMSYFASKEGDASLGEIIEGVQDILGEEVPYSSIRSYLRINTPDIFQRTGRGRYKVVRKI